jgi:acetamidase/formamidase
VHWGYYDARLAPVLHVADGDRVQVETMIAGGLQRLRLAGVTETEIPEALKTVEQRVIERGPGAHPLTGPIYVDGAQAGDTLEIHIVAIEFLHDFGVNAFSPGSGAEVARVVETYSAWLAQCRVPKLFINAEPGSILVGRQREFCRAWPNQREVTVRGVHFIQEDSPAEIGRATADFVRRVS